MPQAPKTVLLVLILWAAGLLAGAQFAKVSVLLPELREIYPAHSGQTAWLLTLVSIVGAVLGGFAGQLANRVGLKRLLVGALFCGGILSVAQSLLPSFPVLAASRVVEGITHLGIVVTAPTLIAGLSSPRWRGTSMALWSTFFGVSFAIFAWFGIPAVDVLGLPGLFQLHGLALGVVALLVLGLLPSPAENGQSGEAVTSSGYTIPRVVWPGVGWLFYTLTYLAALTVIPLQLSDALRPQITTAMSLVGIAASMLIIPLVLQRLSATTVVMIGFSTCALISALGASLSLPLVAIALFTTLGLVQGGSFAAVAELNSSAADRTRGYGAMAQTGNIGNLIGTPALLFVLGAAGNEVLFPSLAMIYALGVVVLWTLARRIADPAG